MTQFLFNFHHSSSSKFGPDFKVIYLARDPRGSINSLLQSPESEVNKKFTSIAFSCNRLYRDILAVEKVKRNAKIKHRLKVVRYEDIVEYPRELVKNIYSFISATTLVSYGLKYVEEHQMNNIDLSKYYVVPKTHRHDKSSGLNKRGGTITYSNALSNTRKTNISMSLLKRSMIRYKMFKGYVDRHGVDTDVTEIESNRFEPNHWKDELPRNYLQKIQQDIKCMYSMKLLGYM